MIKTVLALKHHVIPPSLHFQKPNPKLGLDNSPFYVVSRLTPWQKVNNLPRRAGVSSLGIGGTNAHVILEEAPDEDKPKVDNGKHRLILLSAKTRNGLVRASENLVDYLKNNPELEFSNMAYTLQVLSGCVYRENRFPVPWAGFAVRQHGIGFISKGTHIPQRAGPLL